MFTGLISKIREEPLVVVNIEVSKYGDLSKRFRKNVFHLCKRYVKKFVRSLRLGDN